VNPSAHLFLSLVVILGACRILGFIAKRLGQPQVVGEMIAGVILGPSLLGLIDGGSLQTWLFPPENKPVIFALAQVGLVLYMFLVGVEFRTDLIADRLRAAAWVSIAGIAAPFALGVLVALGYHSDGTLFMPNVTPLQACLFMGAAMAITAFPVLARIIEDAKLMGTRLGSLALGAGSLNDAFAWCVLAVVLASLPGGSPAIAAKAIGGGFLYVLIVFLVFRPVMRRMHASAAPPGSVWPLRPSHFAALLILLATVAWYTDTVGIHAVFGAFFLGLDIPRGHIAQSLQRAMTPLTITLLVPMFFVYSGLNTKVTLLDSPAMWGVAAVIIAAACVGKYGACAAAARLSGESVRESLAIGALMNCRGMMELIILNIGYERGLITPALFSIGVLMAILTTLMATPLFEFAYGRRHLRSTTQAPSAQPSPP
jgi:K+:H+ antiporter